MKSGGHEVVKLKNGNYGHISYAALALFEDENIIALFKAVEEEREDMDLGLDDATLARMYGPLFQQAYQ